MKPKRLVHPSQARTLDNPTEIERLLQQGWLLAAPKGKKDAAYKRKLRRARRAEGWANLTIWLSPDDLAAVRAARCGNESYAALLVRLVKGQGPA